MREMEVEVSHRVITPRPLNAEARSEALKEEVTPADRFFIRSNFPTPDLDGDRHRIELGGAVERPFEIEVAELRALPMRRLTVTTECAGNGRTGLAPTPAGEPWGYGAVSTAQWAGVSLREVLDRAGIRPEAVEILARGGDRGRKDGTGDIPFARALPLSKAFDPDTLLALEVNGAPLPPEHGSPVRLLVPGWYGMASVKWLSRLEAVTEPFTGYFQRDRYVFDYGDGTDPEPVTTMRVRSIVTEPGEGAVLERGTVRIRGWAWSGSGAVTRVEVATEGGDGWVDATLGKAASPHAWRPWSFEWEATEPGVHILRSRATDEAGNVQPDRARWNRHGYGNNAIRPISVEVRGS